MNSRMVARGRILINNMRVSVRSFSEHPEKPMSLGPGGPVNKVPTDFEVATGREREELKAFAEGREYFNRFPVQMKPGDGTFENPILVPSELSERATGIVPKGQDQPVWFMLKKGDIHYLPRVDLHFKLYNPHINEGEEVKQEEPVTV